MCWFLPQFQNNYSVMEVQPEVVPDVRLPTQVHTEVVIKWSKLLVKTTLSDSQGYLTRLPKFHLEYKVAVWEEGNARNRTRPLSYTPTTKEEARARQYQSLSSGS